MQLHPLETAKETTLPDFFPTSEIHTISRYSCLAQHQPLPLSYIAPAQIFVGDRQIQQYRVKPYDEIEIQQYQRKMSEDNMRYVAKAQQLLTLERSQLKTKKPEIIQQQTQRVFNTPFDYQQSTKQIVEELEMDTFQPRFQQVTDQVGVATVAGNDLIGVGGAEFQANKVQDNMRDQLMQNFLLIQQKTINTNSNNSTMQNQLNQYQTCYQHQQNINQTQQQYNMPIQQNYMPINQNQQQYNQQIPQVSYNNPPISQQPSQQIATNQNYNQNQNINHPNQNLQTAHQHHSQTSLIQSPNLPNKSVELDVDFADIQTSDKINKHIEFNKQAQKQINDIDNIVKSNTTATNAFKQQKSYSDDLAVESNFSILSSGVTEQSKEQQKPPIKQPTKQISITDDSLSEFNIEKIAPPAKRPESVVRQPMPKQTQQEVIDNILNGNTTLDSTLDMSIEAPKPAPKAKKQVKKSPTKVAKKQPKIAKPAKKQQLESSEDDSFLAQIMKKDARKAAKKVMESSDDLGLGFSDSDF